MAVLINAISAGAANSLGWMPVAMISTRTKRMIAEERKTVDELLQELELSTDHIVLVDGKRMNPDDIIQENDLVIVLPLIAGG